MSPPPRCSLHHGGKLLGKVLGQAAFEVAGRQELEDRAEFAECGCLCSLMGLALGIGLLALVFERLQIDADRIVHVEQCRLMMTDNSLAMAPDFERPKRLGQ